MPTTAVTTTTATIGEARGGRDSSRERTGAGGGRRVRMRTRRCPSTSRTIGTEEAGRGANSRLRGLGVELDTYGDWDGHKEGLGARGVSDVAWPEALPVRSETRTRLC